MKIETYWNAYRKTNAEFYFYLTAEGFSQRINKLSRRLESLEALLTEAIRCLDAQYTELDQEREKNRRLEAENLAVYKAIDQQDAQAGKRTQFDGGGDV